MGLQQTAAILFFVLFSEQNSNKFKLKAALCLAAHTSHNVFASIESHAESGYESGYKHIFAQTVSIFPA